MNEPSTPAAPTASLPLPAPHRRVALRRILLALSAASAVLLAILAFTERSHRQRLEREAHEAASKQSLLGVRTLNETLAPIMPAVLSLAADMGGHDYRGDQIAERLKAVVDSPQQGYILEAGVAFAPYAYDPKVELYAPHYLKLDGVGRMYQREAYGNYTHREWFSSTLVRGPGWSEPELGHGSGELILGIGAPFYRGGPGRHSGVPTGVVRLNTSVAALQETVGGLTAGRTRYGYLLSAAGAYVSHPLVAYVQQQKTVFEMAAERHDRALRECIRTALAGQRGEAETLSELTRKPAWVFCEPVQLSGWALVMVYEKAELLTPSRELRREQLHVLVSLLVTLSLLAFVLLRVDRGGTGSLWAASFTMSMLLAWGLAVSWSQLREAKVLSREERSEIFDHAALRSFEAENKTQVQGVKSVEAMFIPAGLYVSTLNLSRPGEALVTGYVWQKYRRGAQDGIARGFLLPDAEQVSFQEAYHRTENGEDITGWSFRATLRQGFSNASKYPFDGAALRIRLWHRDFDKAVVLVPDLDAYTLMIPGSLPGLEPGLSLPGWDIQQTFFDYAPTHLGTDFGMRNFTGQVGAPELGFNVVAKREFLDPFFASLMPIAVVDCILFVLLLCATRDEKGRDRFGFKPMTALSVAAGTLFVILVAHNNMRSRVAANEIIFLEFFYFVAYATIILVAANAIAVSRVQTLRLVHSGDNLAPKIGFWPLTLASFLAITIGVFY